MARLSWGLLGALLLMVSDGALGADSTATKNGKAPAGIWKVTILSGPGQQVTPWLVQLNPRMARAPARCVAIGDVCPRPPSTDIRVKDGQLFVTFKLGNNRFRFEGKLGADGTKKILGSLQLNQLMPAELELTGLKNARRRTNTTRRSSPRMPADRPCSTRS